MKATQQDAAHRTHQMGVMSARVWIPFIAALWSAVLSCSGEHNPSGPPAKEFLTWEARFGGTGGEEGTCAVATPDGGFLIVGVTSSSGAGVSDAYVIKVDSSGHVLSERTVGGSTREWVTGMAALEMGSYVVTGVSNTLGQGDARAYAFELDQEGVPRWERAIVPRESFATAVVTTPDGGLAFTGQDCGRNIMLLKTDPAGTAQWSTCFDGGWGKALAVTSDSGFIVVAAVGEFGSSGGDILMIRTDSQGRKRWSKRVDIDSDDWGTGVLDLHDGTFAVCGWSTGQNDAVMLKLTDSGVLVWLQTFGGALRDAFDAIIPIDGGGFVCAGSTATRTASGTDVWLVGFNGDGTIRWQSTFGGPNGDAALAIAPTLDGGYLVVGKSQTNAGDMDVYVAKTDSLGRMN